MRQLLSISSKRWVLIILSALVVGAASMYFLVAEAVSVQPVGTLSVVLVPNAGTAGTEFVTLEYSGFGVADMYGWTLNSSSGFFHSLSGISIADGQSVKICEQDAADPNCAEFWNGNDVFSDSGDALTLMNPSGVVVVTISYSDSSISTLESNSGDYSALVYGKGDKVRICHSEKNGGYREHGANASTLVRGYENDKNSHSTHVEDIIPDFTYNMGRGFGYHPGNNWPEGEGMLTNGCQ